MHKLSGAAILLLFLNLLACEPKNQEKQLEWPLLKVSENGHYFQLENGEPFFWLGDTGWLLFKKTNREQAIQYLDVRKRQGFNVIQVMLLHELSVTNWNGIPALVDKDASQPYLTDGNSPEDSLQYDYWDHVDFIVDEAAKRGIYMALVPVWGTPVSGDQVSVNQAGTYAAFLGNRFKDKQNIIWLNGGDVVGDKHPLVWEKIGQTLDSLDSNHLISYHPRGRRMSSEWFDKSSWMDFNMCQSGHRNYDQDTARDSYRFGPDNWRYIEIEFNLKPAKPTLDGEPSYEEIPHGLHDTTAAYWEAGDLRRYGYWSVFAGGAGFTYGHNSVMQFFTPGDPGTSYGPKSKWQDALEYPGANQMQYLKELMLSQSYFDRSPAQELVAKQGEKYDYIAATKGKDYAMFYTYTGREISVNMGFVSAENLSVSWYNPRTGETTEMGQVPNQGIESFDPPGEVADGNDWVLILKVVS